MSEVIAAPAASAPAASAPSAPAATPSTAPASAPAAAPASTPVVPAAAPAATPAATPATPAAAPPDAGKSTFQVLQEAQAAREAAAAATPPPAEAPAVTPAAPAPGEPEAAATTTEEKSAEDTPPSFDDFELDPVALAPKALSTRIETDPALAAALEANPDLKNELFGNARLAAETAQFKEVFGSPAEAQVAAAGHATFMGISSAMTGLKDGDPASLDTVMGQMLQASAIRTEAGELQYDKSGALVTNGSVGRFLRNSFRSRLGMFAEQFAKEGNEEGQAAIDILMESAGLRAPSSANQEDMSEEMRTQSEALKAERAEIARERQATAEQAATSYNTTVNTRIDAMMDTGIAAVLSRATGLNDFSRKVVEANIRTALAKEISKNPQFQFEMDKLDLQPYGPERQKQHMALATRYFQTGLARVTTAALAEAGASITRQQQTQADKSAARAEAARSETRGALPLAKTAAPVLSERDQLNAVTADLAKTLGRSPSNFEVLSEKLKRQSQQAA